MSRRSTNRRKPKPRLSQEQWLRKLGILKADTPPLKKARRLKSLPGQRELF